MSDNLIELQKWQIFARDNPEKLIKIKKLYDTLRPIADGRVNPKTAPEHYAEALGTSMEIQETVKGLGLSVPTAEVILPQNIGFQEYMGTIAELWEQHLHRCWEGKLAVSWDAAEAVVIQGLINSTNGNTFDFVNSRYTKEWLPVDLDDISEFIRLSSATMWFDGQLVSIGVDVPRISGEGLLIEPQRTNNFVGNLLEYDGVPYRTNTTLSYFGTSLTSPYYELQAIEDGGVGAAYFRDLATIERDYTVSAAILKVGEHVQISTKRTFGGSRSADAELTTATDAVKVSDISPFLTDGGYIPIDNARGVLWVSRGPVETDGGSNHYQVIAKGLSKGEVLRVYAPQAEIGFGVTSYIPTDVTPATRAPDILNIPLLPTQTITGDWDEGVMFEVADNIATFTGHGYIRNITVEEI